VTLTCVHRLQYSVHLPDCRES